MGAPFRSVFSFIIWGPLQINFFAYYRGGHLRSVSSQNIWEPPQISFFAYYKGPPQVSFFAYYMGPPQIGFCVYFMGLLLDQFFHLLYGSLSDQFFAYYTERPQISFFAYYMEGGGGCPLRSSSLITICPPPFMSVSSLTIGGPPRLAFSLTTWGPLTFFLYIFLRVKLYLGVSHILNFQGGGRASTPSCLPLRAPMTGIIHTQHNN